MSIINFASESKQSGHSLPAILRCRHVVANRINSAVKLLIVDFSQSGHMGAYLTSAARQFGMGCEIIDVGGAEASSRAGRSLYWRFRDKRPARLDCFGAQFLDCILQ